MTNNQELIVKDELQALSTRLKVVPPSFFVTFGCLHCEWRSTDKCPMFDDDTLQMTIPKESICDKRKVWVLSLIPDYDKTPTLAQVQLDFNKRLGTTRMLQEYNILLKLEAIVEQMVQDQEDDKKIAMMQNRVERERFKWSQLWKHLVHYEDQQVNRETTKKIDITQQRVIRPSDVALLMKKAKTVIDVTPEKVDEEIEK